MTTARQQYEQKIKVVTFRVHQEVYEQLEEVKARTGLSNSDLMKLGTGIAREEMKAKLANISGLEDKLAELESSVTREEQSLRESLSEERKHRLGELGKEMKVFKLFDRGWRVETVSYKLGILRTVIEHV